MAMLYRKMGDFTSPWPGASPLVTGSGDSGSSTTTSTPSGGGFDWGGVIKGATQLGVEITRAAGGYYDQPTAQTYQPGVLPPGYKPSSGIGGISTTTLLLLGGGALVLFLVMGKKGAA